MLFNQYSQFTGAIFNHYLLYIHIILIVHFNLIQK